MKDKKCIICSKKKFSTAFPFETHFNSKIFHYKKCLNCKFIKIFPYLCKKDLEKLYDNKSYHEKFYSSIETNDYKDSVKYLNKFLNNKVKLLDFGSGNGHFINEINEIHKCYGVEYSLKTIKLLKKKFKKAIFLNNNKINNKKYNNFFDVIHLGDVLEHIIAPDDLLLNLHKKIKKKRFTIYRRPN